jgi:hypothetical protein
MNTYNGNHADSLFPQLSGNFLSHVLSFDTIANYDTAWYTVSRYMGFFSLFLCDPIFHSISLFLLWTAFLLNVELEASGLIDLVSS